jgi:hypothetical protein
MPLSPLITELTLSQVELFEEKMFNNELINASLTLDLPSEIWIVVFSKLDIISLLNVSRVNKQWTRLSNEPFLWRQLCQIHQISLQNEEAQRIFEESLLSGMNAWKKLFIRHHKNEQRNRILGKLFWASYEVNALQRFLNIGSPGVPTMGPSRMLTYNGQAIACPQCEREKELLSRMEICSRQGKFFIFKKFL